MQQNCSLRLLTNPIGRCVIEILLQYASVSHCQHSVNTSLLQALAHPRSDACRCHRSHMSCHGQQQQQHYSHQQQQHYTVIIIIIIIISSSSSSSSSRSITRSIDSAVHALVLLDPGPPAAPGCLRDSSAAAEAGRVCLPPGAALPPPLWPVARQTCPA